MAACAEMGDFAPLGERFADFIAESGFACVGAKAALKTGSLMIVEARDLGAGGMIWKSTRRSSTG